MSRDALTGAHVQMLLDNPMTPDWRVEREARALQEQGATVAILSWDRECRAPEREESGGLVIERVRTPSRRQLGIRQLWQLAKFYRRALRLLRARTMDVVHAHDLLMLPLGVWLSRTKRAPLLYDAHEIYQLMEAGKYPQWLLLALAALEGWLIRHWVDLLLSVSDLRTDRHWRGVAGDTPIYVVGNWYDPVSRGTEARHTARKRLGLPADGTVLVYAGGLTRARALHLLIDVARSKPQLSVVIAGRGHDAVERGIAAASEELGNLRFVGWLEQPEVLYEAADALYYVLNPEHPYSDMAASNTLYIAIAYGVPLITSDRGEPGEIMREVAPELALSVLTTEALAAAVDYVSDSEARAVVADRMAALQQRYNWRLGRERLCAAYHTLISAGGASG